MTIDRTTIRMAARRGVSLYVTDDDATLEVGRLEPNGAPPDEYRAAYAITSTGLYWSGSCYGDTEEWPRWIPTVAALRQLLPLMAHEV